MTKLCKTNCSPLACLAITMVTLALVASCILKFVNLKNKVFWQDETFSALRIAGNRTWLVNPKIFNAQITDRNAILAYEKLDPTKGPADVVGSATEMPEVPPLYYFLAHAWERLFGSSMAVLRSFSGILSLFAFPLIYWLCLQLFESRKVACLAVILVALSPFHLIYSQEARPYTLAIDCMLLSSCLLLRAREYDDIGAWSTYVLSLALGLWSQLVFVYVIAAHGIWLLVERAERSLLLRFAGALGITILLFSPWLLVIIQYWGEMNSHLACYNGQVPLALWLNKLTSNLCLPFFDIPDNGLAMIPLLRVTILLMQAYAIYCLVKFEQRSAATFLLILAATGALVLVVPDLIFGGVRALVARYWISTYVAMQIMVAAMFARHMLFDKSRKHFIWAALFLSVMGLEIWSCAEYLNSKTWWNKYYDNNIVYIAKSIQSLPHALVIGSLDPLAPGHVWALCWQLKDNTRFLLLPDSKPLDPSAIGKGDQIVLFYPSANLKAELTDKLGFKLKQLGNDNAFYAVYK